LRDVKRDARDVPLATRGATLRRVRRRRHEHGNMALRVSSTNKRRRAAAARRRVPRATWQRVHQTALYLAFSLPTCASRSMRRYIFNRGSNTLDARSMTHAWRNVTQQRRAARAASCLSRNATLPYQDQRRTYRVYTCDGGVVRH